MHAYAARLALIFAVLAATTGAEGSTPPLAGEPAVTHLKASGQYDSLALAITAARYAIMPSGALEGQASAQNPAQGIRSDFTSKGLRLTIGSGDRVRKVGWQLVSYGYGAEQITVPVGKLQVAGQRAELKREILGLTEWYANGPGGLEHGFTLATIPRSSMSDQPLRLILAVTGDLSPHASPGGKSLVLRDATGHPVLSYEKLRVWDADGTELPSFMTVANNQVVLGVEEAGARYPLTIDPTFVQQAYMKASNTGSFDEFGISLAISGNTVVVGARGEDSSATGVNGNQSDNNATDSGAAYVFVRSGTSWTQQAYLKASNTGGADNFGSSVSIDGNVIVVGAPGEDSSAVGINGNQFDNSATNSGAAYGYLRSGSTWTLQAYIKASNTNAEDHFGQSVSVSEDWIVIGAPGEDSDSSQENNKASNAGAAYVFTLSGTALIQAHYLKATEPDAGDSFGSSVANDGSIIVVGAPGEDSAATGINGNDADNSAMSAGAAYYFQPILIIGGGMTWGTYYMKASNTGTSDYFGSSVAISSGTVVVGATGEDSSATGINGNQANNSALGSGAAYVFRGGIVFPDPTHFVLTQEAYLKASNTEASDNFGGAVAISGDVILVGAEYEDGSATGINGSQTSNSAADAGAAYMFARNAGAWGQYAYLKASNTGAADAFGHLVAISGNTMMVGAPFEDSYATGINGTQFNNSYVSAGAAYTFLIRGNLTLTIQPPEAAAAGARWRRVGTSTWFASGATESNVAIGSYQIEFLTGIPGFGAPVNKSVTLPAWATTTSSTGTYFGPPTVTGITESSSGGTRTITVSGTNFQQVSSVLLAEQSVSYVVNSVTQIVITVPDTNTSDWVVITTPAGTITEHEASYLGQAAFARAIQFNLSAGTNDNPLPDQAMIRFIDAGAVNFGMVDPLTGLPAVTGLNPANFNDAEARIAQAHFRHVLQDLPGHHWAQSALLRTLYGRIIAYNFGGNNSVQYSSKARLLPPGGNTPGQAEMKALADAYYFYKQAALAFTEAAGNAVDSPILDLTSPYINVAAVKGNLADPNVSGVVEILDAFGRAMALQGKTALRHANLHYLQSYTDPLTTASNPGPTLALIDGYIDALQMELMLAQVYRRQPVVVFSDFVTVQTSLAELKNLRQTVARGNLVFGGFRETSSETYRALKEYPPEYVPFLAPSAGMDSFTRLQSYAAELAASADQKDDLAQGNTTNIAVNRALLGQKVEEIRLRYLDELKRLCGYTQEWVNGQMQAVPDMRYAVLPPAARDAARSYNTSGNLESKGQIHTQWLKIEIARKEVRGATLELSQIYDRIEVSRQTAGEIANLDQNLASLILENGNAIAAMDVTGGEISAYVITKLADIEAKQAEEEGQAKEDEQFMSGMWTTLAGAAEVGVAIFTENPLLAIEGTATFVDGVTTMATSSEAGKTYQELAYHIRKTASIQADAQEQLAQLEAAKERLRASEKAAVQYVAAQTTLLKNAEEIHYLYQQAERQLINIAVLEDRMQMEVAELADMYGRVGFLMQEYTRAMVQAHDPSYNPLTLPDYRILKERSVEEAEDAFVQAQRWAYLTARLAQYEDNFSGIETTAIRSALLEILKARTGAELSVALTHLTSARTDLELNRNSTAQGFSAEFSVRNDLAQNNYLPVNADGTPNLTNALLQHYPNGLTSNQGWLDFLEDRVVYQTGGTGAIEVLEIPLSITLERPFGAAALTATGQQRLNPFFNATRYDDLINYNPTAGAYGVQVMVQTHSLSFTGGGGDVTADLSMEGASQIRSRAWLDETDGTGMRSWNLQRATDQILISMNSYNASGNPLLHNRSPGNDRWVLRIYNNNANTNTLIRNLNKVTDIKLKFHIRGFVRQ